MASRWSGRLPLAAVAVLTALPLTALGAGPVLAAPRASAGSHALATGLSAAARTPGGRHTVLLSAGLGGQPADASSDGPSISRDGRYVAFESSASNLVAGHPGNRPDIYVADTRTHRIRQASLTSTGGQSGTQPGGPSGQSISGNGRYVVFSSDEPDMVPGDTNGAGDVFVRDLKKNTTRRVSLGVNGVQSDTSSGGASISDDGRYVVFSSNADNLVPGDTNKLPDLFVRDLKKGTVRQIPSGTVGNPLSSPVNTDAHISGNGRYVVFESFAADLVPGDTNGETDIFRYDLRTAKIIRVSVATGGGQAGGGIHGFGGVRPSISDNGQVVAFDSYAGGLVAGPDAFQGDSFVRNLVTGVTQRVALSSSGAVGDLFGGSQVKISPDGHYATFQSYATNLVPGDTNGQTDVFVRDLRRNRTTRVSVGSAGQSDGFSGEPVISKNGAHVAFMSDADNLVPGARNPNDLQDIYLR